MSPDRRPGSPGLNHIDYGYKPVDGNGTGSDQAAAAGYRLKDRGVSPILQERVYKPLNMLKEGARVLSLGAGDGNFESNAPKGRAYSFISIEQDPKGVESIENVFSEQGKPSDRALVGDITKLDEVDGIEPESVDAAVSWRVVHALPDALHEPFLGQVYDALKPGGSFFMAVLSDQDWKREELEAKGEYKPGEVNECVEVMRFGQSGLDKDTWPLYFFSEEGLDDLAGKTGFVRVGEIDTFKEQSGFDHLLADPDRRDVTYHFVELQKPDFSASSHGEERVLLKK